MASIVIIGDNEQQCAELRLGLESSGFTCTAVRQSQAVEKMSGQSPRLVLLALDDFEQVQSLAHRIKERKAVPVVAVLPESALPALDGNLTVDDFIVKPCRIHELVLRVRRFAGDAASGSGEVIRHGDLQIDLAQCQVTVAGRLVELTYREYELLRFLVKNRGRVFSRNTLLDRVWGYDYFGGDRTVDVHIRRLRSKIEDASHCFIDTVRNMGYRFKES